MQKKWDNQTTRVEHRILRVLGDNEWRQETELRSSFRLLQGMYLSGLIDGAMTTNGGSASASWPSIRPSRPFTAIWATCSWSRGTQMRPSPATAVRSPSSQISREPTATWVSPSPKRASPKQRSPVSMLQLQAPPKPDPLQDSSISPPEPIDAEAVPPVEPMICPHCQQGRLIFIRKLTRQQAMGP
jgi:hypothetical protein